MRNRSGPKTEPCGTPEGIFFQDEHWASYITPCLRYQGSFNKLLSAPSDLDLNNALTSFGGL